MDTFFSWLLWTATFFVGFFVGRFASGKNTSNISQTFSDISETIKPTKVGAVNKLTPEQARKRGTIQEETEQEMSNIFRRLFGKPRQITDDN